MELVRRGLVPSRERAQEAVAAGVVLVAGAPATSPARLVASSEAVRLLAPPNRFVSRGGDKLDAALERFRVDVAGLLVLDAGASTGGFTDCLLQRGAAGVVALDVGRGQLHERLRADPRVQAVEGSNVRHLRAADLGGPWPVVVADLSFISLRTVAAALVEAATGDLVVLVKPQFEAGREEASRGKGVIRDPEIWRRVLTEARNAFSAAGAAMMGVMPSPLTGAEGNVEFLMHLRVRVDAAASALTDMWIDAAVAEAIGDGHG